jgi:hypothetical protein
MGEEIVDPGDEEDSSVGECSEHRYRFRTTRHGWRGGEGGGNGEEEGGDEGQLV